jgi:esterase/lipase superfamily enzyme
MPTTVHFASNRVLTGPADSVGSYGPDIQPPSQSGKMAYGTAFVDHIDLATNTPGVITEIQNTNLGGWAQEAIGDLSQPGRNLLVFIHGFDNTFSDAVTRAALNREWLAASGVLAADTTVVAFSWPSLGQIVSFPVLQGDYLRDQQKARLSGVHLMTFFAGLEPILRAARANANRTILLAHSMGNLALESAVENWFAHGNGAAPLFDVTILAAADCGYDAFDQPKLARLSGLGRLSEWISIYYSHADHVLQLSQFVNAGAQRLGQDGPWHKLDPELFPPEQYRMIDATQANDYDVDFLTSHQYYRLSPSVRTQIAADMGGTSTLVA